MNKLIKDYLKFYGGRTLGSAILFSRAEKVIPGGVCHNIRYHPPYPCYLERAQGSRFWDVDGNEYLDFWMGHYANILGHSPQVVIARLQDALSRGTLLSGIVNPWEVELAELICDLVPSAEAVRFCCSGTEAAGYAARLSRAYTGRSRIIKIEGGWHGACSELLYAVKWPYDKPESVGLPAAGQCISIPFNDPEAAAHAIRTHAQKLAAVFMEPVVGVGGFVPAEPEFLHIVREETAKVGALLVFDEIITGFRLGLGGAQKLWGVFPDVTVLGKVLGGGLPIGAVSASSRIMQTCNPFVHPEKWERAAVGGGTFSGLPLNMIAGIAMLRYLKENQGWIYPRLEEAGKRMRERIEETAAAQGILAKCTGIGSLFMTHFPFQAGLNLRSPYDVWVQTQVPKREVELKVRLLNKGIYVMHGGGAISIQHTQDDLEFFYRKLEEVFQEMQAAAPEPGQ